MRLLVFAYFLGSPYVCLSVFVIAAFCTRALETSDGWVYKEKSCLSDRLQVVVQEVSPLEGRWLCTPEMIGRGEQLVRISHENDDKIRRRQPHLRSEDEEGDSTVECLIHYENPCPQVRCNAASRPAVEQAVQRHPSR